MIRLICATTNPGKLREFALAAGADISITSLPPGDPPDETGATFEENAAQKAAHYSRLCDGLLFAEDSGLEVDALGGAPGIYSARYAGAQASDEANNTRLLEEMNGKSNRRARYVCAIAVARQGEVLATFRGTVEGDILAHPRGEGGFGYDPLFWYPPFAATFGEVSKERKFEVSHRRQALDAMFTWLRAGESREGAGA